MSSPKRIPRRFTRITLRNWRNFSQVDLVLQRRVFLVGPNASGKSNLQDVFRFLHDLVAVGGGFQAAVENRGGVTSLRCLAARQHSDITIHAAIGDDDSTALWEYELWFNQDKQRRPLIKRERVWSAGEMVLNRPNTDDKTDPARLSQTYLEQVYANQKFRPVADFFKTTRYSHIVPQLVREPDRSVGRSNDPFGGDFLERIAETTDKTRGARLRKILRALKVAVPLISELELTRDNRGTPHLRGKYEHWRPQGAWQSEECFSDGTLRLLGLLWATLDRGGPLLLEEPELSLHPGVVRYIPQMLARVQTRSARQIIVSTHSTELLQDDGIGTDEVLLLKPTKEGTDVSSAADSEEIKRLLEGGVGLSEAVMPQTAPEQTQLLLQFPD